jgi:hypothetical protein
MGSKCFRVTDLNVLQAARTDLIVPSGFDL